MTAETFEGVQIDRCGTCKGIFLDQGELGAMLERKLGSKADTFQFSATSDAMDVVNAHCTKCDQAMDARTTGSGLRVDVCAKCLGVFLDQGELASLQLEFG